MNKSSNFISFIITFIVILVIQNFLIGMSSSKKVSYDEFQNLLKDKKISEVYIDDKSLQGVSSDATSKVKVYTTNIVNLEMAKELEAYGVKFQKNIENTFFKDIFSWIIPPLIFVLIWVFL